jgi:hypothetical protein
MSAREAILAGALMAMAVALGVMVGLLLTQ